jgi:lipase chaperone LimK
MVRLLDENKLKLKADKARKAEQTATDMLKQDSLRNLQARCKEMAMRKQQLLDSGKLDEIRRDLSVFHDQIEQLKARKASIESHEAVKDHEQVTMQEKLRNQKNAVERNVFSFLGKKVQLR